MVRLDFLKKIQMDLLCTVLRLKGLHNNMKTTGIGKYENSWEVVPSFLQG